MRIIGCVVLLLAGCTIDGDVSGPVTDELCTDTRDGETFIALANSAHNARIGIGTGTCADVKDSNGNIRTLCTDNNAWLKCVPVDD